MLVYRSPLGQVATTETAQPRVRPWWSRLARRLQAFLHSLRPLRAPQGRPREPAGRALTDWDDDEPTNRLVLLPRKRQATMELQPHELRDTDWSDEPTLRYLYPWDREP